MKTDLATAIGIAIFGVIASFITCNLFFGEIEGITVKKPEASITADLVEPDKEVFNYLAIDPTVEVYVGDCKEYNDYGECTAEVTENLDGGESGDTEGPANQESE